MTLWGIVELEMNAGVAVEVSDVVDAWEHLPRIAHPSGPGVSVSMFPHQLVSVCEMERIEAMGDVAYTPRVTLFAPVGLLFRANNTGKNATTIAGTRRSRVGINANKPGFGKTIEMAALVFRDNIVWDLSARHVVGSEMTSSTVRRNVVEVSLVRTNATLILASPSTLAQWFAELSAFGLDVARIASEPHIAALKKTMDENPRGAPRVVLVGWRQFAELVKTVNVAWKRFIFDDPPDSVVKNMGCVAAGFHWLVTATPENLYRPNVRRNAYISDAVPPHRADMEEFTMRLPDAFVESSFKMPEIFYSAHPYTDRVYAAFRGLLPENAFALLADGDTVGALSAMGVESTPDTGFADAVLAVLEHKVDTLRQSVLFATQVSASQHVMQKHYSNLQSAERTLAVARARVKSILDETCMICISEIEQPVIEVNCQTAFCAKCLLPWLAKKPTCPMCRTTVVLASIVHVSTKKRARDDGDGADDDGADHQCNERALSPAAGAACASGSASAAGAARTERAPVAAVGKVATLKNLLLSIERENPNHRTIIFSNCFDTLLEIKAVFAPHVRVETLLGSSVKRARTLDEFRSGGFKVLFLNSTVDSAGINLQCASNIVMMRSDVNETQMIGRAVRIGRVGPLFVHRLVCE